MTFRFKQNVAHIAIALFSVVVVVVQVIELTDEQMNMYKAIAGLVCFFIACLIGNKQLKIYTYGIALFMSILMILSIIYNNNARLINLIWIWSYIGVAQLLFEYGANKLLSFSIFYLCATYFLYSALYGDILSINALGQGSANNISILCIYSMFVYYISFRENKDILLPYIPPMLVLFISIWAGNRSGIISCVIFFLFLIYANKKYSKHSHKKFGAVLKLIVITIGVTWLILNYIDFIDAALINKLDRQGMESSRSVLWVEYFNGMFDTFGHFMFGVPSNTPAYPHLAYYLGNPHNTFLVLHSKYGIVGLMFILITLGQFLKKSIQKSDYLLVSLFVLVFTRSMFDWAAFPGLFDVLFWYFIFYAKFQPHITK